MALKMELSLPLEIPYFRIPQTVKFELSFLMKQQFQMVAFEDPHQFQVQAIKLVIKHVLGSFDMGRSLRVASQI